MSYARDPYGTDEPPRASAIKASAPCSPLRSSAPPAATRDKPVTEPEGNEDEPAYADCEGCTCCSRQGCHRGPDSECPYSDAMLSFLCPCTED